MIARVDMQLRREALRERMQDMIRREAGRLIGGALDRAERAGAVALPDEKLTGEPGPDGLSRNV